MSDGTLQTLDVTMLDDVNNASGLIQLDSNAKIPACSGAALTNLPGVTKNASDPAIATNPSGGVGSVWQNTTSGAMFICTDATAGGNVWKNIGEGSGNIKPWYFGGTSYGFVCGRHPVENATNRWSFASDGNGTDWGTTVGTGRYAKGGHSDKDNSYGYHTGGYGPPINEIVRFSMTTASTSNDVGDLTQTGDNFASMGNATHGWVAGNSVNDDTRVEKFAFASSGNATDWSDLMAGKQGAAGATDGDGAYGYTQGGREPGVYSTRIQKINLTTAATATDVSNLTIGRTTAGGTSSSTYGYCAAGYGPTQSNVIDKFNMSTEADSTDVGDCTITIHTRTGSSSTTYGYTAGGTGNINVIEKHSFTTDGNATDVGDLSEGFEHPSGTQY